jgi:hypothetical protein
VVSSGKGTAVPKKAKNMNMKNEKVASFLKTEEVLSSYSIF